MLSKKSEPADYSKQPIVYTTLRGTTPESTDACKGASCGQVEVLNAKNTDKLLVEKHWSGVTGYDNLTVYVALFDKEGNPVKYGDNIMALALTKPNDWEGIFTVALNKKDQPVFEMQYKIKELSSVNEKQGEGYESAVFVNAEEDHTVIYYKEAVDSGLVKVGSSGFVVTTGSTDTPDYTITVTNHSTAELPSTGGHGTAFYTIAGTILIASGVFAYTKKRKNKN